MRSTLVATILIALCAASPAGADLPPLHAERHADRGRIVDDAGREFLPHGVNVNQLGEYRSINSHPANAPLTEADFKQIAGLGFDSVRLLVTWSLIEPQPGQIDRSYLDRVEQAVAWGRKYGVYSLIDMHQDAWSIHTGAPPGTICAPGFEPNRPWDGAPAWATLTDGMSPCFSQSREISPAVAQSFQSFWDDRAALDGTGIQTHLVNVWREVARRFAGNPAVMGYDLLNEPNPGFAITGADGTTIAPFYRRAIAAIREADGAHTIFVEPNILRSIRSDLIAMPFVSGDTNLGYAPHIYGDRNGLGADLSKSKADDAEWSRAEQEAALAGGSGGRPPVLIGEFGALDPPNREAYTGEALALADKHLIGWQHWVWKETCGNPHFGYGPVPPESLWAYDCSADRFTALKAGRIDDYSRPYPQFAGGRLTKLDWDAKAKRLEVKGRSARPATRPTEIFLPLGEHFGGAGRGVSVAGDNVSGLKLEDRGNGTGVLRATSGAGDWSITVIREDRPATARKCRKAKKKRGKKRGRRCAKRKGRKKAKR